jgi:hypothetical protein
VARALVARAQAIVNGDARPGSDLARLTAAERELILQVFGGAG